MKGDKEVDGLDDFVVYRADLRELEKATECYATMLRDNIEELEQYCLGLKPEEFTVRTFNRWFEAKKQKKCRIHRLLAYAIRFHDTPLERAQSCLSFIQKVYRTDWVRQYKPLILCSSHYPFDRFKGERRKLRSLKPILNTVRINGVGIEMDQVCTEDDLLEKLRNELSALGFEHEEFVAFLQYFCLYAAQDPSDFGDVRLNKIDIGRYIKSSDIFIEFTPLDSVIQIHVVRNIVEFCRLRDSQYDQPLEEVVVSNSATVLAKSTSSFRMSLKKSAACSGFFEQQPEFFNVEPCGAVLEVYDTNARSIIVRDLGRALSKKIRENVSFDGNDEIVIQKITKDIVDIKDLKELIKKLIADKNTLKLVLAMRMNRLLICEVLKSPELLIRLCSDSGYEGYLQLLKFWHLQDITVTESLTRLMGYIQSVLTDQPQKAWEETIDNIFYRTRDKDILLKFSALFALVAKEKKNSMLFLINNSTILSLFEEKDWLFQVALYFYDIAKWFITSGYILKINMSSQRFAELMIAQPGLWEEMRAQKQNIRELPVRLLRPDQLCTLLTQNEDKSSRDAAAVAFKRSRELFNMLCGLAESRPDELLKYFSRYHKLYRTDWPDQYQKTELYLLSVCNKSTLKRYFESRYGPLKDPEFCEVFCTVVLDGRYPNVTEMVHQQAKDVLMAIFIVGLRKKRKFQSLWNTSLRMTQLSELLEHEPSVVNLVQTEAVPEFLRSHPNRGLLIAFVECIVRHHSDPRVHNFNTIVPLLPLLLDYELRNLVENAFSAENKRYFILVLLIKYPDAIELFRGAQIDIQSEEFIALLSVATAEHLLLLLIALHSRQQELHRTLNNYKKLLLGIAQGHTAGIEQIENELDTLTALQSLILESADRVNCLFDPAQSTPIELACLISLYTELEQWVDPESLDQTQRKNLDVAKRLVQVPKDEIFGLLTDPEGVNTAKFVQEMNPLLIHDPQRFYSLLDSCLLQAFGNNNIRVAILTGFDFLRLLMIHADLRLLTKFIVVFGRSAIPEELIRILGARLVKEPDLMETYKPFIYVGTENGVEMKAVVVPPNEEMCLEELSWSLRHSRRQLVPKLNTRLWSKLSLCATNEQVVELLPYCDGDLESLRQYLLSLSDLSVLPPNQLVNLLILTHHLKAEDHPEGKWFEQYRDPQRLCEVILNRRRPTCFVLSAIPFLDSYYPKSEELVNAHMDEHLDFEACKSANVCQAVEFMFSTVGPEVVFKDDGSVVSDDVSSIICELFLICNVSDLRRFARTEYINILIQYHSTFNGDAHFKKQFLSPRIALILIIFYEKEPNYIEDVFEQNDRIVEALKASLAALQLILSSVMYETSEKIRAILDVRMLADDSLFIESSPAFQPMAGQLAYVPDDLTRRRRLNRHRAHPITVPGSQGDSEQHSSSSFSKYN